MVAGRRTHADLVLDRYSERGFPYAFADLHAQTTLQLVPGQRIRGSVFGSRDRFRMFLGDVRDNVHSEWTNAAGSVRWDRELVRGGIQAVLWGSRYQGNLTVGALPADRLASRNDVRIAGARLLLSRQGDRSGFRAGAEGTLGQVDVIGPDAPGGYLMGQSNASHRSAAAFVEVERWVGRFRLGPGLRLEYAPETGRVAAAPRVFVRYHLGESLAITGGLSRSHQRLSTLRDDRFPLPGPPFWFAHDRDMPTSQSDAAILAVEGWLTPEWSFEASVYRRSFDDIARWRPTEEGRSVDALAFDDGSASGLSAWVRRHGRLSGWVGYEFQQISMTEADSGTEYSPPWERRHTVEAAVAARPWRGLRLGGQLSYSTGAPFWPQNGAVSVWRLDPLNGVLVGDGFVATWSQQQMQLPQYVRLDVSVRWPFHWGETSIEPHLSVLNVTGRQNVLYYRIVHGRGTAGESSAYLHPELQLPIPAAFPSLGIDVRF